MDKTVIDSYPRYDSYKDSGEDWIAEIPTTWNSVPLRNIFKFRNEKNNPVITDEILSLSIAHGVTKYSDKNRGGNKRKDDITAYKIARPNDIVLNSMNIIVGAVGLSKYFGAISPVYYALYLHSNEANINYYEWVFHNNSFQKGLLKYGKGILIKMGEGGKMNTIRMKISQHDMKYFILPFPPLKEQEKIARFLESRTTQIDQAINLKQQQIAKLEEYKQIVIQNAVTKGLNPDAQLKDSGVDWIGDIPKHWEVKKLKYIGKIKNGIDYKHVEVEKGYPVIGSGGQFTYASKYLYDGEAVLLGRKGTIDKPLYINGKFWTVDTMFYYICKKEFSTKFVYYCATTIPFSYFSTDTALPSITQSHLNNHKFAVPNLKEQNDIVQFLDTETSKFQILKASYQTQINRLKEYKTILINQAVTGKIKVN
ncbi:restriction endonuclease subunit S [Psychrobacter sp.]|uniref:restriction endonuclease subunit S n=1 Tax=Psychrobacter sp. TaxID=56811 RepID=UPI003561D328